MDEKKAIEKGKEWMKNSKDPIHGYEHAKNVEEHSLKIFQSLKDDAWDIDSEIDENLILLCVWWHDCYKALFEKKVLLNEFVEGKRSAEIVKEEIEGLVSEKRLKRVLDAISHHNNIPKIIFKGRSLPILTRILIEADGLDARNEERRKKRNASSRTFFHKALIFFAEPVMDILHRVYLKSSYARNVCGFK